MPEVSVMSIKDAPCFACKTSTFLLLIWWYVKAQLAKTTDLGSRGHFRHIESKRLAHASVLSLFEVNNKKVLVLQAKHGASFIDITDTSGTGRNDHV